MKDGRTHLAHKHEHAVDMETGAVLGGTLHRGAEADSATVEETLSEAEESIREAKEELGDDAKQGISERIRETVLDKGCHSNAVLLALDEAEIRAYVAEPRRGRRRWKGKAEEKRVVYANRRRIKSRRSKHLMRRRGELLERPFAHMHETGGMRRTHLRRHDNILKRLLIHAAGLNLSLLMRTLFGVGSPRSLQGRRGLLAALLAALFALWEFLVARWTRSRELLHPAVAVPTVAGAHGLSRRSTVFTTGC